ncbi:MAG: tetratricopeptide repeat protein, partial [bacterium]|nr:tetratricopeptide repeat protein [bacterium]
WAEIQDNTFKSLAKLEPESLLAVAFFHQLAYVEQTTPPLRLRLSDQRRLSEFTKTTILALVDLYLERAGKTAATRKNAALPLIALANTLRTLVYQNFEEEARDVYFQALKLDPDNAAARYGAAFQEEKLGRYRRAVRHLERLREAWPDDVELGLRLALNLARTGELRTASDALESIARGDSPAELRILAYQELASLHAQEHGATAIAYLREAVERFPQSWRLSLQLSNLLHRDWNEAVSLAERVAGNWAEDPGISPRFRYEFPREEKLGNARLVQEIDRLRPALARALERLAERPISRRKIFRVCRGDTTR